MVLQNRGVDDSDADADAALPTIVCQFKTTQAKTERKDLPVGGCATKPKGIGEPGVQPAMAPKQLLSQNEVQPSIGNLDDWNREVKKAKGRIQTKVFSEGKKLKTTPEYLAASPSARDKMMQKIKERVNNDYKRANKHPSQLVKPVEAASAQSAGGAAKTPELPHGATAWSEGYRPRRRAAQVGSLRIKNLFDSLESGTTATKLSASLEEAPMNPEESTTAQELRPPDEATPLATVLTASNERSSTDSASPSRADRCSPPDDSAAVSVGNSSNHNGDNSRASFLEKVHAFLNSGTHIMAILDHRVSLAPVRLDVCNAVWSIELYAEARHDQSGQSGWKSEFELSWVALDLVSAYWNRFPGGRDATLNLAVPGSSLCSKRVLVILGHREVASRFELLVLYQGMGMGSLSWEWIQSLNSRFALDSRTLNDYWNSSGIREPMLSSYDATAESVVDLKSVPVWASDLN